MKLFPTISEFIHTLKVDDISDERRSKLNSIKNNIKSVNNSDTNLMFICTHNSRRSQFAQIWATVFVAYYEHHHINVFSGGTEVTELNKNVIDSLRTCGFTIRAIDDNKWEVSFSFDVEPFDAYSKLYNQQASHLDKFIAIMTCDHADQNCPFIPNATKRFSLPYSDPKIYDSDARVIHYYNETNQDIATEMKFLFS